MTEPLTKPKKTGAKRGKYGENIKARMGKFNGFPLAAKDLPKSSNDFYDRAQLILMQQIGKLTKKSVTSSLDINEIRILDSMVKTQLVLDSKQQDLPQDTSPELLEQALNMLKDKIDKETDEPNTEDATSPKKA
jgi:hypothetical protein